MAAKQGSGSGSINLLAAAPHEKLAADLDPKFEWIENATNYLLRLNLSGFKKEDFRVQVDSAGKLTVRGQRPAAAADGKHAPPPRSSFHKVFQLPSDANLDDISGRFEASVLTLTVPKRKQPMTIQEIKKPKEEETSKALEEATRKPQHKEDALKKAMDDATTKPQREQDSSFNKAMDDATTMPQRKEEDEARARKQPQQPEKKETQKPASMPMRREEVKPKAPEAAPAPANKPEVAGDKAKAVDRESLAERVKRRAEEERAKAAAAAAAAAEEAKREKKMASGGGKERVAGELDELTDMKWAERLVEMARNNKEVVAAAIAALSLGFFVSRKLFSRK